MSHTPAPHRNTPAATHPDPGRRHGHHGPAPQADRGGLSRRAFQGLASRPQGQQRPAGDHQARGHQGHPLRIPGGGRGHHRDRHLRRQRHHAESVRHGVAQLRAEHGRCRAGARGLRRIRHRGQAALRRRRARPDRQDRDHLARRERPGGAQHHLRPAGGRLCRSHARPDGRRRRPDPDRDHLRHAERQGRDLRGAAGVRSSAAPRCRS